MDDPEIRALTVEEIDELRERMRIAGHSKDEIKEAEMVEMLKNAYEQHPESD